MQVGQDTGWADRKGQLDSGLDTESEQIEAYLLDEALKLYHTGDFD